jgi:hypothetical protein
VQIAVLSCDSQVLGARRLFVVGMALDLTCVG